MIYYLNIWNLLHIDDYCITNNPNIVIKIHTTNNKITQSIVNLKEASGIDLTKFHKIES
jgi:hypothetical protein